MAGRVNLYQINDASITFTTAKAPTVVAVGTSTTQIVGANSSRQYLAIVNDSDTVIYLTLGNQAAVVGSGIRLNANGGSFEITFLNLMTGVIQGIHGGSGTKNVTVMEAPS